MVDRKRIGLIYVYDENWIAGAYYIENIVFALNTLPENLKPLLVIYTHNKNLFNQLKDKTEYEHLEFKNTYLKYNIIENFINKIGRFVFKKNLILKGPPSSDFKFDFVFPNPEGYYYYKTDADKKVYWIPDFQEDHLPNFFSGQEVIRRKICQLKVAQEAKTVVFSSKDSYNDFVRLYPASLAKKVVLPFAVRGNRKKPGKDIIQETLKKYNIEGDYFIVPNQLYIHKNHKTVLLAIKELIKDLPAVQIVFTGKEQDPRFPNYPSEIKLMADELNINKQAKFLGFIPQNDLDNLITDAHAIIQPSLSEGWNTAIEEAKLFNKFIIASDIAIHLEQLEKYPNKTFFLKMDPLDLARKIEKCLNTELKIMEYDYEKDIELFARKFLEIL
jgi:glycosyltransferase involved in cell wall biosynthesis